MKKWSYLVLSLLAFLFLFSLFLKEGFGFVWAAIIFAIIALILIVATGVILDLLKFRRAVAIFKLLVVVYIVFAFCMLGANVVMSYRLLPMKEEFITTAEGTSSIEFVGYDPNGKAYQRLNYQGALDKVIAQRDDFLSRNHFLGWGGWVTSSSWGPTCKMAYIYWPFSR